MLENSSSVKIYGTKRGRARSPGPEKAIDLPRRYRGRVRYALAYPNKYGVGMANLGFQTLLGMLGTLPDSGCERFFADHDASIESGSPRVLADMNRSETLEVMKEKIELVDSATDIKMTGFFVLGYPIETKSEMEETIALSLELPLRRAAFANFLPLPGTEIYDRLLEEGAIDPKNIKWNFFRSYVQSLVFQ